MSDSYSMEKDEADKKEAKSYCEKFEKLESDRRVTESTWQEVLDYVVPRKGNVLSPGVAGEKRGQELFDSTAIMANLMLAAALHGMLTNPTVRFFEFVTGDPNLDQDEEIAKWLQECADRLFVILNNSNFQTEIHEFYIDLISIGTATLFTGEHEQNILHFGARAMKECYIEENNLGRIDTLFRKFTWKPRQVVQEFGLKNLHPWVVRRYEEGCSDDWTILNPVHPLSDDEAKKTPKGFPFKSLYILKDENIILNRDGFREFPYAVSRWTKTSGEKYGRGCGTEMLPDIKMVNAMMETTIKGAQKTVDPPLMMPDDSVIGKVRLTPGGLTVVRVGDQYALKPLITDARIDFGYQAVEDVRKRIRAGFYVDQLQLTEGPQMTAVEVNTRTENQLRLMGPVLGRQNFEFLDPTLTRAFLIAERRGQFPSRPEKIRDKSINVRFSSLVARAQRMSEGQNLMRAIAVAAPIINAKPEALDLLNADRSLEYILFDVYGAPRRLRTSDREIKQSRDARAEAQKRMAEQTAAAHQADVASKIAPGAAQLMQAQAQAQKTGG